MSRRFEALDGVKPPRTRQPRQPIEVRREQVLDAAVQLINQHGFAAVTMEAVAKQADLAKPVVYNAFPGRGPLLQALLKRERARGLAVLAEAMQPKLSSLGSRPFDVVMAWLSTFAYAIAENPQRWRLILMTADQPEEARVQVDAARAAALEQLKLLLAPGLTATASRPAPDLELIAHGVLAVGEQCARLMIDDPEQFPPQRLLSFAEMSLRMLRLA